MVAQHNYCESLTCAEHRLNTPFSTADTFRCHSRKSTSDTTDTDNINNSSAPFKSHFEPQYQDHETTAAQQMFFLM